MTTTKADVLKLIESSAEKIQQHGETREQAFTRYITKTDEGRELFAIHKRAPGPDRSAPPVSVKKIDAPKPALRKLLTRAEAIAKAEKTTTEIAFAKVYSDAANRDLVMAEKRERLGDAAA